MSGRRWEFGEWTEQGESCNWQNVENALAGAASSSSTSSRTERKSARELGGLAIGSVIADRRVERGAPRGQRERCKHAPLGPVVVARKEAIESVGDAAA